MLILGIFLCVISLFILYKRFILILFGKSARGYIIGYGNCVKGTRGIEAYCYKIKYEYKNQEYIANSLESTSVPTNGVPNKNIHREVTIYFKPSNPQIVTIKEFKETTIIGFSLLILGIISVIV